MPVVEQQTHVVTTDALVAVVTLAQYGVKRASRVNVSVEVVTLVKETYMENIVTYKMTCANAHPILKLVVEINPNV